MAKPTRLHALQDKLTPAHSRLLPDAADCEPLRVERVAVLRSWSVQGPQDDEGFRAAAESALGGTLPAAVGMLTSLAGGFALGIGPGSYLIVEPATLPPAGAQAGAGAARAAAPTNVRDGPREPEATGGVALTRARALIDAAGGAVFDVTHGRAALRLHGNAATTVLAKGTGVDLHPSVFGPRQCRSTLLATVPAVIVRESDAAQSFLLLVPRSYAQSFWHWLTEACREFGYRIAD